MGLDVGIITIRYLERPHGRAYEFAWELAVEASVNGYMYGEGNNWGPFEKQQVRELLNQFAENEGLSVQEQSYVWTWVESLPWNGGIIELHFNW